MIIRKKDSFRGMHIVRNCSSIRCKESIHAHTYEVEMFLTARSLDNGHMVMDFGLLKGSIKDLIGSFNKSYSMWNKEGHDFKELIYKKQDRWIEMPVSPSAESYSLMFMYVLDKFIKCTEFNNGEQEVSVASVRVHETLTGYAESFRDDLQDYKFTLDDIIFSDSIKSEWKDPEMYEKLKESYKNGTKCFINPVVEQQV